MFYYLLYFIFYFILIVLSIFLYCFPLPFFSAPLVYTSLPFPPFFFLVHAVACHSFIPFFIHIFENFIFSYPIFNLYFHASFSYFAVPFNTNFPPCLNPSFSLFFKTFCLFLTLLILPIRLLQRYQNVKAELEQQQNLERIRMEKLVQCGALTAVRRTAGRMNKIQQGQQT